MYYDNNIEKKIPAFYILMNSKTECAYNEIFTSIKEILTFGLNKTYNFKTITTDNEDELNNSICNNFPNIQCILCYFHYKQTLEKNARKMGLCKANIVNKTKELINN